MGRGIIQVVKYVGGWLGLLLCLLLVMVIMILLLKGLVLFGSCIVKVLLILLGLLVVGNIGWILVMLIGASMGRVCSGDRVMMFVVVRLLVGILLMCVVLVLGGKLGVGVLFIKIISCLGVGVVFLPMSVLVGIVCCRVGLVGSKLLILRWLLVILG